MGTYELRKARFIDLCMRLPQTFPADKALRKRAKAGVDLNGILYVDHNYLRTTAADMYAVIEARYKEAHRAYHVIAHIDHLLSELDGCRREVEDLVPHGVFWFVMKYLEGDLKWAPLALEAAIWFHDLYETPGSATNVLDSARHAGDFLRSLCTHDEFVRIVQGLILASTHRTTPDNVLKQYFVDMDLSILGQPKERYKEYEREIYVEYVIRGGVPIETFVTRRIQILERFLLRGEKLYSTEFFRAKYGAQALLNLAESVRVLKMDFSA